jgi:alkylated DNA nucleotide flippase Atl1/isopentenyldiphosphate isomerase
LAIAQLVNLVRCDIKNIPKRQLKAFLPNQGVPGPAHHDDHVLVLVFFQSTVAVLLYLKVSQMELRRLAGLTGKNSTGYSDPTAIIGLVDSRRNVFPVKTTRMTKELGNVGLSQLLRIAREIIYQFHDARLNLSSKGSCFKVSVPTVWNPTHTMKDAENFKDQVIGLVRRIPSGRIVSYGQIARVLGRSRASRVVGGFLAQLPPGDDITPWHRVVNRKGGVSHRADVFCDVSPVDIQRDLLIAEGLEPGLKGQFNLREYGMSDSELRALFDTEMLEIVDSENRVTGIEARSKVRRENLLHRGVGILCWNSRRELYVHQRTATKDVFPSCFDMMVGGALEAGEAYQTAALREIQEELGVGDVEITFLLETLYEGPKNRSWIQLFEVCWDGPIVWQDEEICWGRWMPFEAVLNWVDEVEIVPDGLYVFREYLAQR